MANIVTKWLGDRFLFWKSLGAVGPAGETVYASVQANVNVKADGTEIGTAAAPLYTAPGTGISTPVTSTQLPASLAAGGGLKVEGVAGGVAQPVTSTQLPASLAAGGGLKVEGVAGGVAQPISASALPLPSGAATSALQGGGLPTALAAGGGLKVEGVAGGVAQPVSIAAGSGAVQFVDENGVAYGVKHVQNKPQVSAMPYLYDIAEGNVTGHAPWSKTGYNADVGTTEEDIWVLGGTYVFPASAQQMTIASTSADDDGNPVGTGVRTVTVFYLSGTYVAKSETVTLNGTTDVLTTATDIFRIQAFRAASCGIGGKAAGTITIKNNAKTITYSAISTGYTRARNITYTVPTLKVLYITSAIFSVHSATKGLRYTLRATYDDFSQTVRDFFVPFAEVSMSAGVFQRDFELPIKLPATVSLKISAIADAAGAQCSVALRGWLEDA